MTPEEYNAQLQALQAKRSIANAMLTQSIAQGQGWGNDRFAHSPLEAIANIGTTYLNKRSVDNADQATKAATTSRQAEIADALTKYQSATPDAQTGAQALQNIRDTPDGQLAQPVNTQSSALQGLARTALGPEQMGMMAVQSAMTPDKLTEVAPGSSLYNQRLGKVTYTAPAKPDKPDKRTVEWKDVGNKLVPVYSDTGEDVPGIAPKSKSASPTSLATQGDFTGAGMDLAVQDYLNNGKLPRGAAAQSKVQNAAAEWLKANGKSGEAETLNRNARLNTLKAFTSGTEARTVRSLNVAVAHLDVLEKLGSALNNGDTPSLNKLGNWWSKQTGSAAPTNFDGIKNIVGQEVVKAIVANGGGQAEREEAANTISSASSPQQLAGIVSSYKQIFAGQLGGLKQQYTEGTQKDDFERFVSPEVLPLMPDYKAPAAPGAAPAGGLPPDIAALLAKHGGK
jgi:hypothetical protein